MSKNIHPEPDESDELLFEHLVGPLLDALCNLPRAQLLKHVSDQELCWAYNYWKHQLERLGKEEEIGNWANHLLRLLEDEAGARAMKQRIAELVAIDGGEFTGYCPYHDCLSKHCDHDRD